MTVKFICLGCGKELTSSKRSGDRQSYCGEKKCQRARKTAWQRQKVVEDPDYRSDQARCDYVWRQANRDYWRDYRHSRPEQIKRNRLLQKQRNQERRRRLRVVNAPTPSAEMIAKMDALIPKDIRRFRPIGEFWLIPVIAKMDAFKVNITSVSGS